jgi:hypothetical protein
MFSNLVKEYKDSINSGKNISLETNQYFIDTYFTNPSPELKFTPPFTPGEIYYFRYLTDSQLSKKRTFINRFPILLCTEVFNTIEYGTVIRGIDLITVPPAIKVDILGKIFDNFSLQIQKNETSYKKGSSKSSINLKDSNLRILLNGTGYKSAVFGFRYKFIKSPGVISSLDWAKLPFLSFSSLEGSTLQVIYKEYQSKLNR